MLGKLLKHDLLNGMRSMLKIYLAAAIAFTAAIISVFVKDAVSLRIGSCFILTIVLSVLMVVTAVKLITGYNSSLFGNEGYLTHTLPVTGGQLVLSKALSGLIIIALTTLLTAGGITLTIVCFKETLSQMPQAQGFDIILASPEIMGLPSRATLIRLAVFYAMLSFTKAFFAICAVQSALCLSNTRMLSRYGTIGTILTFFVIWIAGGKIIDALSSLIHFYAAVKNTSIVFTFNEQVLNRIQASGGAGCELSAFVLNIAAAVGLSFLCAVLINKKINLK